MNQNDTLEPEDLKQLLRKGLERKTKDKKVLEWFDFEFHTIYEAGKWKGLEDFYFTLRGKK